jgi:hypothetical protein
VRSSDLAAQHGFDGVDTQVGVGVGLEAGCGVAAGKPFVLQPDDSFDDDASGHERTQSNPPALLRKERRAAAGMCECTRTRGNVFLNRVAVRGSAALNTRVRPTAPTTLLATSVRGDFGFRLRRAVPCS